MTDQYSIIAEQQESTVVARYEVPVRDNERHQSEAQMEAALIRQLCTLGYTYPQIHDEAELVANLRQQLQELNGYEFTDSEWKRFFEATLANETLTIEEKTALIQQDDTVTELLRDNGEKKNIKLIDKRNIHNNRLQVINQYRAPSLPPEGGVKGAIHDNRYDVTILVNGLPLVHIELKQRGVSIREAFNQINRYQRESFWAGKALMEYVQVFVISNGTQTKYYSNTTRFAREKEAEKETGKRKKVESNSFEFTSYWSDAENNLILDIEDFAQTFLTKRSLLNILTRYCVFTADRNLMVMRPYQIAATERILLRIETALNNKWQGTTRAGGFIWHTTGSGKTLTSFKTSQLASKIKAIKKVLFVVDRQDLDYQTMKEYDNFEPNCANGNTNSDILYRQLQDPNAHIIITTIQKLNSLLKNKSGRFSNLDILSENVVFIFDECHRSQFGDMHQLVTKKFRKYLMFGFTGTPIFPENAGSKITTTAQIFGGEPDEEGRPIRPLHTYTIINAISDRNVLKFKVDYVSTMKMKEGVGDEQVWGIKEKEALMDQRRIAGNVEYILRNFDLKTKRSEVYDMSRITNVSEVIRNLKRKRETQVAEEKVKLRVKGFNSLLAVESVPMAIAYYREFKRQMALPGAKQLRVATIFTFGINEDENENALGMIEEDPNAVDQLDATSREFLDGAIADYNQLFGTNYDTGGDKFQNYYKDVSLRMKNREVDLLIVVGMFLTGFDAKTLNTLWVDKGLKMHGLLQAFSRTNRILNAVKTCGNVICFRNLEKQVNESFALFGDKNAGGVILMRSFKDYYYGFQEDDKYREGYRDIVLTLLDKFPVDELQNIVEEKQQREFIRLFGNYLRAFNLLTAFDEFNPEALDALNAIRIIKMGERQDYLSWYNDLHEKFRGQYQHGDDRVNIEDDLEFEMELVKQVQIDITYILGLVNQYKESHCQDQEVLIRIMQNISASPDMRDKKKLIENFIARINPEGDGDVYEDWDAYVEEQKREELERIITDEQLKPQETRDFMRRSFQSGYVEESGVAVTRILPPMPVFGGGGQKRAEKKSRVLELLKAFFSKFFDISGSLEDEPAPNVVIEYFPKEAPMPMAAEEEKT